MRATRESFPADTVLDLLDSLRSGDAERLQEYAPRATGFTPLDAVLRGGLRPGELTVLVGKPGQGKTITALQWARHVARSGHEVVFASFEHNGPSLLARLLTLELGDLAAPGDVDQLELEMLRERLVGIADGRPDVMEDLLSDPLLARTHAAVQSYGARLRLVCASADTTLDDLERLVAQRGPGTAVFVDYLQKIRIPAVGSETAQGAVAAERLKALALRNSSTVVAITTSEGLGLASRRLHLHHARGAAALAYEADVAIVLNEKLDIISRLHLAYDTSKTYDYQARVVFSIEKNRNGLADVHLEFRKDFANYRFHPQGEWVAERLWEEGSLET